VTASFLNMPMARAAAESLMGSTCVVHAKSDEQVTDPVTGRVTNTPGAVVYSGACRVRPMGTQARTTEAGGAEMFDFDYLVSVPFSATGIAEGMSVTVTASPDPTLVGVNLEIQKVDRGEHITARRLSCNEVT
jgi:hypothetical protein